MIGIQVTKDQINQVIGINCNALNREYDKAVQIKAFFDRTSDADLITLGFTQDEASLMKSAYADLAYQAVNAFGSSTFVKQLFGLGI